MPSLSKWNTAIAHYLYLIPFHPYRLQPSINCGPFRYVSDRPLAFEYEFDLRMFCNFLFFVVLLLCNISED